MIQLPSTSAPSSARSGGFTLLEVMIALAIVSVSIVAIAGINSGSIGMHTYAKRLTVATLLARGKMADIEQELQSEGLPLDDEVEDGDFGEEGYPRYRWRAEIIRPKTEDIQIESMMQSLGMADGEGGALGGFLDSQMLTQSEFYTGASGDSGITTDVGSLLGSSGLVGGALTAQLQQMIDELGKTVREVRLTVSWSEGKQTDQFSIVTHVVSLGEGTDQRQSDAEAQAREAQSSSSSGRTSPNSGTSSSGPTSAQSPNHWLQRIQGTAR